MGNRDVSKSLNGLYVIVDPEHTHGRPPEDIAKGALSGGASVIQLRDKISDKGPMLEVATRITELCNAAGALHIMNDHADIAVLSGSHGLHVGQTDLPVSGARRIIGPSQLIGTSNHAMNEAQVSISNAVDYIAVGASYGTATKDVTVSAGLKTLGEIRAETSCPIAAIGGINASNIAPVIEAGAEMACVITAVGMASDPERASRELVRLIQRAR